MQTSFNIFLDCGVMNARRTKYPNPFRYASLSMLVNAIRMQFIGNYQPQPSLLSAVIFTGWLAIWERKGFGVLRKAKG